MTAKVVDRRPQSSFHGAADQLLPGAKSARHRAIAADAQAVEELAQASSLAACLACKIAVERLFAKGRLRALRADLHQLSPGDILCPPIFEVSRERRCRVP
jgi:hypothetical protein